MTFFDNPEDYSFGIITQKGYKDLENQIEKQAHEFRVMFRRWFIITFVIIALIGLTSASGLVGFTALLRQQKQTTNVIQQQRRDTIQSNCENQNARHDHTAFALSRAVATEEQKHHSQKAKMRIRNSGEVSLGLIDALAPKQDCVQIVQEATGDK